MLTGIDLGGLAARLPARPLTRFAPAPTGWLHLGHVLNAEYVWGLAAALDGRVLLRIEDHDRERSRPEFENGILDDLDWLGFQADLHQTRAFRAGRCDGRQSDRQPIYESALRALADQGLVYGCDCPRSRLRQDAGGELFYPGICRDRHLPLLPGVGWRLRMDPGVEEFDDARLGTQAQEPAQQCGDLLVRDRHGNWTYQFAVAVDDADHGVDLIVRGIDLLASTGRQLRIARLLGRERMPVFLHHPLIMKSSSQKLSKSDGDTGVRVLRELGWSAAEVRRAAREAITGA